MRTWGTTINDTVLAVVTLAVVISVAPAHAASAAISASASVNKSAFRFGTDEVDFVFTARNDSKEPIAYREIRRDSVLVINGKVLKDSGWIFANGPGPTSPTLNPGETTTFGYRLTDYFKKPGRYKVVWKGPNFTAKPVSFTVVESTKH